MRFFIALFVALCLLGFGVRAARAHVLLTDGDIGAVLHIDPEDDPVIGRPANFFFEFKDRTGRFRGSECDCTVHVSQAGRELVAAQLFTSRDQADLNTPVFSFTFPEKGIYHVEVQGVPRSGFDFQSFALKEDLRVDRIPAAGSSRAGGTNHYWHIIALALPFIYVFGKHWKDLTFFKLKKTV